MHVGSQVGPSDLLLNPRCMLDPIITVAGIHVVAHRGPLHCATDTTDSQKKKQKTPPQRTKVCVLPIRVWASTKHWLLPPVGSAAGNCLRPNRHKPYTAPSFGVAC